MIGFTSEDTVFIGRIFQLTALHWASDRGKLELVDFLIRAGADINIQDYGGQTPLHYGYFYCKVFMSVLVFGWEMCPVN